MEKNLRLIPKMDDFLEDPDIFCFKSELSGKTVVRVLREEIENLRGLIKSGGFLGDKSAAFEYVKRNAVLLLEKKKTDRLKRVINATGIIIHTNLGRAPLSGEIMKKVSEAVTGYNNLEYSFTDGKRRGRMFYLEELLRDITSAEAALVVNNNAAAIFLVLNTLCKNKEVIISRGEIVEIGDSFRISEIIKESGCIIKEAGTTNKTRPGDYENLITEYTSAFLKVHQSNFKIIGFTGEASSLELVELKSKYPGNDMVVIEDMGSGILSDLSAYGLKKERTAEDALNDGVDIVTFSGDKILGGPQAGIIIGKKKYVDLMKKNQMYRCLRIDKMCLAALEAALCLYRGGDALKIPVIRSIAEAKALIYEKANKLNAMLNGVGVDCRVGPHTALLGGGALPGETIDSFAVFVAIKGKSAREIDIYLRHQTIPIISTIQNEEIILDMRTVDEGDFEYLRNTLAELCK